MSDVEILEQPKWPGTWSRVRVHGLKLVATVPDGMTVVGMCEYDGRIIVATSRGVYALVEGEFKPIKFADAP